MTTRTIDEKWQTIIGMNTLVLVNKKFEDEVDKNIERLISETVELQLELKKFGCNEKVIGDLIEKNNGLILLSTYTTLSLELLQGIITSIRLKDDEDYNTFFNKDKWNTNILVNNKIKNWGIKKIQKLIQTNKYFKECIVKIFINGYDNLELKNYSDKINSIITLHPEVMDSMLRKKLKGSNAAKKENNAELKIEDILNRHNIPYTRGDLRLLFENEKTRKRTSDFIIGTKDNPLLILECSYQHTTSSSMGDKAKAENGVTDLVKKHYPKAKFVGFIDGVGWVNRSEDLKRLCEAFDDVYTFHDNELKRFEETLKEIFPEYF
jgi:hypothetical protein